MDYIHKLPFILSSSIAVIVGMIGFTYGVTLKEIYIRMAISMVVFFALGVYARNTIKRIVDEVEKKKEREKEERIAEEQLQLQRLENKAGVSEESGSVIDYKVDDYGEDFSPFPVSEYLNKSNLDK